MNEQLNHADPTRPIQYWIQESHEGRILFIVFYTQACRWSKCSGCNLHTLSSTEHVSFKHIMAQIDYIFYYSDLDMNSFDKVIISNNGSVLDEKTFSTTALLYLIAMLNIHATNATTITIETRPEYVDMIELEVLKRALLEGNHDTNLEIAIGLEAYDDKIRNEIFNKGLSKEKLESLVISASEFYFDIKCYIMLKPVPGMTTKEAIKDIHDCIQYLSGLSKLHSVPINIHINPTYVAFGTKLEEEFNEGKYEPPTLIDLAASVYPGKLLSDTQITIFCGLDDEGLAIPGGSFIREGDQDRVDKLEEFNRTQNYKLIEDILIC